MNRDHRKKVRFDQLRRVMSALGYGLRHAGRAVVFERPDSDLFVVLPAIGPDDEVRPIDLMSVMNTLIGQGLIRNKNQFQDLFAIKEGDRLVWTDPTTGRETAVVARSGETSDGKVVIGVGDNGEIALCPVAQLRPAEAAPVGP